MKNISTILHQPTEYWIRPDSLVVGGKKLLGFQTTKFFLIQFVEPLRHTSAAWIALFACAMLMPQNSSEEQCPLLACALVTPEKSIDHQAFQRSQQKKLSDKTRTDL
jgi:hypothetical protein